MNIIASKVEEHKGKYKITLTIKPWFRKPYTQEFVGDCTIWLTLPSFESVNSFLREDLWRLLQQFKYENDK